MRALTVGVSCWLLGTACVTACGGSGSGGTSALGGSSNGGEPSASGGDAQNASGGLQETGGVTATAGSAALGGDAATAGGDAPQGGDRSSLGGSGGGGGAAGGSASVSGISKVLAGEYQTFFLAHGRLFGIAGTSYRLGAGVADVHPLFPPREVAFASDLLIVDGASGLHRTIAADQHGHVWEWGDIDWNPALAKSNVPLELTLDSQGKPFSLLDDSGHNVRSMAAGSSVSVAVKGDGTVWVWDDCTAGVQGDGTAGSTTFAPFNVPIPLAAGVGITKVTISSVAVAGSEYVVALASDGSVWTWGGGGNLDNLGTGNPEYQKPHQVKTTAKGADLPPIVDISGGSNYAFAVTAAGALYAWGQYGHLAGICASSSWCPSPSPVDVTTVVTKGQSGGATIRAINTSSGANYAIMTNGSLWAFGSNGQGLVGNGVETDYANSTPPYTFDFSLKSLPVTPAVRITSRADFSAVFSGTADVFYAYALTSDGRLFSWGRNKTGDLGNGISPLNSPQAAAYPNSWDVTQPTEVLPLTATDAPISSPYCLKNMGAANCWCGTGPGSPQGC